MATVLDSPVQEAHRNGVPPRFGRRVVLVPGSPDATPESIQNRFAGLAEEDPLERDGQEEFVRVRQTMPVGDCASGRPSPPSALFFFEG